MKTRLCNHSSSWPGLSPAEFSFLILNHAPWLLLFSAQVVQLVEPLVKWLDHPSCWPCSLQLHSLSCSLPSFSPYSPNIFSEACQRQWVDTISGCCERQVGTLGKVWVLLKDVKHFAFLLLDEMTLWTSAWMVAAAQKAFNWTGMENKVGWSLSWVVQSSVHILVLTTSLPSFS